MGGRAELEVAGARVGEGRALPGDLVHPIAFSPDGKLLVTSGDSGTITEWRLIA